MSNNQGSIPGLQYPQISSYTPGAGNPRDSALMAIQNTNAKQTSLMNAVGGRKRHVYKGGQPATIIVPQMKMSYTPQNGASNPNTQIKSMASTGMQGAANKVYDNQATKMGGSRRKKYKKGGNADWIWGCYSGGRKRTKRNKSKKNNNRTKHRRRH
jgi:hypothetical protein